MDNIAFQFPGQGSQYVGMGKTLYNDYNKVRNIFEEAGDVLGFDFKKICFEGSLSRLNQYEIMLPAILTVSYSAFSVYMEEIGVPPVLTAGHSLGEYSALVCSGALSFSDALRIVSLRAKLGIELKKNEDSYMSVIDNVNKSIIQEECERISKTGKIAQIACINAFNQIVVSGNSEAIMAVEDAVSELGGQITPILNSPPYHCSLMEQASIVLYDELKKTKFNQMKWPVISNVTAMPYSDSNKIVDSLTMQIKNPVQWKASIDYMIDAGVDTVIEFGPQSVLSNLLNIRDEGILTFSFTQTNDRNALKELFEVEEKDEISEELSQNADEPEEKNDNFHATLITKCLAAAVSTKNNNWDNEQYEAGVVKPYYKIQQMQIELEESGQNPTLEQMKNALSMLYSIFRTKGVPKKEQEERFKEILNQTGMKDTLQSFIETMCK